MRTSFATILVIFASCIAASTAWADAIDGKWCDGAKQIAIEGPKITLPSGKSYQGDYTRHSFDFIVPDNEESAGDQLRMMLQGEELMHLQRTPKGTGQAGPIEAWRRCANIS
jgi:hypothetical protein